MIPISAIGLSVGIGNSLYLIWQLKLLLEFVSIITKANIIHANHMMFCHDPTINMTMFTYKALSKIRCFKIEFSMRLNMIVAQNYLHHHT